MTPHQKNNNLKSHTPLKDNVEMCLFCVLFFFIGEFIMKKLYAIQTTVRNLKNSHFSFVKMLLLAIMVAFLSNVFSVNAGDVKPKSVKRNEKAKSSEVSSSVPVNEGAATSGLADAGVMNVDVTASAEGLQANNQANNVSEDSRFGGRIAPVAERALVSYDDPTSLRARLAANNEGQQFAQSDENPGIIVSDFLRNGSTGNLVRSGEWQTRGTVHPPVTLGKGIVSHATDGVIIGDNAKVQFDDWNANNNKNLYLGWAVAIGFNTKVAAGSAVVVGTDATISSKAPFSIAIGRHAQVREGAKGSIAMGFMSHAFGQGSIAIGSEFDKDIGESYDEEKDPNKDYTTAGSEHSLALGSVAKAMGVNANAIGYKAEASGVRSIAFGPLANALENDSIAIGSKAQAANVGTLAIGSSYDERQVLAKGKFSSAVGYGAQTLGDSASAFGVASSANGSNAVGVGSFSFADAKDSIAVGNMAHATGKSSVAIGGEYNKESDHGENDYTTAGNDYTTAVGAVSKALAYGSTALGHRAYASVDKAISIGFYSQANGVGSVAIGADSNAKTKDGIALGSDSIASRDAGVLGYAPSLKTSTTNTKAQWKSTHGIVSVGDYDNNITRQITGVAAGTEDTDAVNIAQLKDLEEVIRKNGWKLSVDNANSTTVPMNTGVDFSAGSSNLTITKGDKDNKVKFDLAKNVTLSSARMGGATVLDATGLVIGNGPKITTTGISAGNKEIKDIKAGELSATSNQAVNGSQLFTTNNNVTTVSNDLKTVAQHAAQYFGGGAGYTNGKWTDPTFKINTFKNDGSTAESTYHTVAEALADVGSSFTNIKNEINAEKSNELVKWDKDTKTITIGKEKDDAKISLVDKDSKSRILSGLKAAEQNDEAVNKAQLDENVDKLSNDIKDVRSVAVFYDTEEDTEEVSTLTRSARKEVKKKSVTFGNPEEGTVSLRNVGNGNVAENSTEAVNGSQLFTTNQNVTTVATNIAKTFGGEAKYEGGTWTAPTFKIKSVNADGKEENATYNDVASAFEGVGSSITNVKNEITKQINNEIANVKGDSLVKKNPETNLITIGKEVEGAEINIVNKDGKARTLSGVAAGSADTDAVNFSQLQKVEKDVKEQVAASSFVKQDPETKHITIGKETDGDKIDIANNKNEKRTLTGIKNGFLSEDSNEAVNGSQLFTTNQNVTTVATNVAKSFGGGASYEDGTWTDPTFKIKAVKDDGKEEDTSYHNVADALSGVGNSITNVQHTLTEQINNVVKKVESESFVQQDKATHSLTIGAKTEDTTINIANKNGADRTLSGVKVAVKDNEAVNKGQLDESLKKLSSSLQSDESAVVHYDKNTDENGTINYTSVTLGGKDKTPVGLHNVADGKIAKDSHDAITGSQVNKIGEDIAKFLGGKASFKDGALTQPTYKLSYIAKDGVVTESSFQG
ncbi:hypothetical protein MEI_00578, partial [Bartonella vinsonii subsp. arupensis Pm136co]